MIKHEEKIYISEAEFERINRLLSIQSLENMSDEELEKIGAKTDTCEGLFYVEFDNGSTMTIDLCSGSHNYYDNVVWTSPDGSKNVTLDCSYKLEDMVTEIDGELYIVKLIKTHKVWVDDIRATPDGYVGFAETNAALRYITTHIDEIELIDLDHDMGDAFGGDCIEIMKELERIAHSNLPKWKGYKEHIERIQFRLHSANPVGVENMRAVIERNGWKEVKNG